MIEAGNLRSCEKCGNVFIKKFKNETLNRCPACHVWNEEGTT